MVSQAINNGLAGNQQWPTGKHWNVFGVIQLKGDVCGVVRWFVCIATHWDRMVNAALVIEAGKLSSLATFLQAFFLITCQEGGGGGKVGKH